MEIRPEDYEKLGVFYLGREYDLEARSRQDSLFLYDSKDLCTHGVVLGMTGSGKTGLCLAMLEEAALDGIPAVVIDPKGDIANLLLTFPDLSPADFRPWINPDEARRKGMDEEGFATAEAEKWRKGLADWGQDGERIARMRKHTGMRVFTPGSTAALPVSILSSLEPPCAEIFADPEALVERIESTAASLLSLAGIAVEGAGSREGAFLSAILAQAWEAGESLTLEGLITALQHPPIDRIGVMPLDTVFPEKDRIALAMRINQLLAAPGFRFWLEGMPLDPDQLLHMPDGRPCISIFSIAHLDDAGRMFFVSLLLNQMVDWMRRQGGTTSLRAMLYMDEIAGFFPPSANPPSKRPMMTLLKQARAFGLGALLATQNPVDLDYKALSNIGSWFIGRLQTERDKARVLDGLESAAGTQGMGMDRKWMDRALSSLGNRVFLLNNVHNDAPLMFETRWVMSYLSGPLTRDQLRQLAEPMKAEEAERAPVPVPTATVPPHAAAATPPVPATPSSPSNNAIATKPKVEARVEEYFLPPPPDADPAHFAYEPRALRAARIHLVDAKLGVDETSEIIEAAAMDPETGIVDWDHAETLDEDAERLPRAAQPGIGYLPVPRRLATASFFTALRRDFTEHLARTGGITLLRSPSTGLVSEEGEDERDFRLRLVQAAREHRDALVEDLRASYQRRIERERTEADRARVAMERVEERARAARMSTFTSAGTALLGALLDGKKLTATNVRRAGSVGNSMTRSSNAASELERARAKYQSEAEDVVRAEQELADALAELERRVDPLREELEQVPVKPLKKNIQLTAVGILWVPVRPA